MPAIKVEALERKLAKSLSAPTHVWWEGPQDSCKRRDLAELDPYHIWDCDGEIRKCSDSRWRTINGIDKSMKCKFGPSAKDIKWGKKIPEARPSTNSLPVSFKLDPYGAKSANPIGKLDRNRFQIFARPRSERFNYQKQFGRDFTRVGAVTNSMLGETQHLDHKSIRNIMADSSMKWI
jgi:hypothetical protein|mmetsp:Transcript_3080/g.5115  ORF Transcript_3080/g.5115 Transcript_3080/m.5115 type:complete len:178 (-) Transcript_3080:178-711(-)